MKKTLALAAVLLIIAGESSSQADAVRIFRVDLMTVSESGFTVTFETDSPAACEAVYSGPEGEARQTDITADTRFHLVSVTGLAAAAEYRWRIKCAGSTWPLPPLPAKKLATLVPPGGEQVLAFAVMNDVHQGEDIAGLLVPALPFLPALTPGFTWKFPVDNYWAFSLRAAVDSINHGPAELTVVNGDLTSWYLREEFAMAKSQLDRLRAPYHVVRGNHDRVGERGEDYFKMVFGLESTFYSFDHSGFHFVILDDSRPENGAPSLPEEELDWLEKDLAANRAKPVFIFSHRPLGTPKSELGPVVRARIMKLIADHGRVAAVFSGHTHAAAIGFYPEAPGVAFITVPGGKEYPLGHGLVRVFEGGLIYNFVPLDCPDCREWRSQTRGEYWGLAPKVYGGKLSDRRLSHRFLPALAAAIKERGLP